MKRPSAWDISYGVALACCGFSLAVHLVLQLWNWALLPALCAMLAVLVRRIGNAFTEQLDAVSEFHRAQARLADITSDGLERGVIGVAVEAPSKGPTH